MQETKALLAAKIPLDDLVRNFKLPVPVYITQPNLPDLAGFNQYLREIWDSRWLTNDGQFHQQFEQQLKQHLQVDHLNLFNNGTIALLVALQALRINSGQVITTPFTFPASSHVLYWNRVTPVFCDIDEHTYNLDPAKIEQYINPDTKAILAVHVYGTPCDVEAIQEIADRHGLHVIYDAAHAFGVRIKNKSILHYGDVSALSFHATKMFTTIEGGALVSKSEILRTRIQFLRNFGIADEETVIGPGINGKMNELQAAFGLMQLDLIEKEIEQRTGLANLYRKKLNGIPGITILQDLPQVKHNYAYFPIRVDPTLFGLDRNELNAVLRKCNIFPRKYFYPLCSRYSCYASLPSARPDNLPIAERMANQVLCLPLYGDLDTKTVETTCLIIKELNLILMKN
jgi:dTDP-4-amino-4,6-dideoxygalactose transaminase